MSDAKYRNELELELERLTRELADVRVEKAQQRQRIEHLQFEQVQLKDQLTHKKTGDKELRTDLADQLHTLHQVVRQKKQEHSKVRQEWERSQEQYNQLKQTVGLLQGSAISTSVQQDNDQGIETQQTHNGEILRSTMGNMVIENSAFMTNLAEQTVGAASAKQHIEDLNWEDSTFDTNTVITEHTKDSLQMLNQKISNGKPSSGWDGTSISTSGGTSLDTDTVITEQTKDSLQLHRQRKARRREGPLSNFLSKQNDRIEDNGRDGRQSLSANGRDGRQSLSANVRDGRQSLSANVRDGRQSLGANGSDGRQSLGAHFEKQSKRKSRREEKDTKSASE